MLLHINPDACPSILAPNRHSLPPCRPVQASNATDAGASTSNPYTTNLNDRQPVADASVGIGSVVVRAVDSTVMPGLKAPNLSTHLVKLGACTSLAPHYHPTADELQYVLQGKRRACQPAHAAGTAAAMYTHMPCMAWWHGERRTRPSLD